jgi:glucose/arabinose dehydrogenase
MNGYEGGNEGEQECGDFVHEWSGFGFWVAESGKRLQCRRMFEDAISRTIRHAARGIFLVFSVTTAITAAATEKIGTVKVAEGFERPVWAGMPKGSDGTLWVMEQAGRIWRVDLATGKRAEKPFLDIAKDVSRRGNEEGLLGLAFDERFIENGIYYVNYSDHEQHTRIARFTSADKETTDPATEELILRFEQDFRNHNGGWIEFGPDGMLYIGNGDGGSANDPKNRAQDLGSLLGKMLRIDVSGGGKGYKIPDDNPFLGCSKTLRPEIWFYGLRNPWRCSFDRETGDLWMGDVGQNRQEEINFMKTEEGAGANFGWRPREGEIATPTGPEIGGPRPEGNVDPVYVYSHGNGPLQGVSVTGGYVYRGPIESLRGRYIFGDYQNPRIWSFVLRSGEASDFLDLTDALQPEGGRINLIASFAEDNQGNLFIVDHTGPVYQIVERK